MEKLNPVEITEQDITDIINGTLKAIDETVFGPVVTYGGTNQQPTKIVSPAGFPLVGKIVEVLIQNFATVRLVKKPPVSPFEQQ